jgi:hypothetical protein
MNRTAKWVSQSVLLAVLVCACLWFGARLATMDEKVAAKPGMIFLTDDKPKPCTC